MEFSFNRYTVEDSFIVGKNCISQKWGAQKLESLGLKKAGGGLSLGALPKFTPMSDWYEFSRTVEYGWKYAAGLIILVYFFKAAAGSELIYAYLCCRGCLLA